MIQITIDFFPLFLDIIKMNFLLKIIANNSARKLITPESFQMTPLDKFYHITSPHFEFVIEKKPASNSVY